MGAGRRMRGGLAAVALLVLTACSGSTPASGSGRSAGSGSTPAGAVTVMLTSGPLGQYLSDGSGRALYMWAADTHGRSTCYEACATAWPPLIGPATAGTGGDRGLLTSAPRTDGTTQVVYGEYPLYYFVKDTAPGDTLGQGSNEFNAKWWVVGADGEPIAGEASSLSPAPPNMGGY